MNATPDQLPASSSAGEAGKETRTAWHRTALNAVVELTGVPASVAVIASFFTENQRILIACAAVSLLAAIGLRFFPGILRARPFSVVLPWLIVVIMALVLFLVLVVIPKRAEKQNILIANSWLGWQKSLEVSAARCKGMTSPAVEECLSKELGPVLENRPKAAHTAIAELAGAVIAGQVLLANQSVREVLQERLSVDDRFIGTGYSEPVRHTSSAAARVPEYFVANLPNSAPFVWVWELDPGGLLNKHPLLDHTLIEVLNHVPPKPRADGNIFTDNWGWMKDHLNDDEAPVLVRFALLDPTNTRGDKKRLPPPSGCLGKPKATHVFMNSLGNVKDEPLREAAANSGYTEASDNPNTRLYVWIYAVTRNGQATRAMWDNVLTNLPVWIQDPVCNPQP